MSKVALLHYVSCAMCLRMRPIGLQFVPSVEPYVDDPRFSESVTKPGSFYSTRAVNCDSPNPSMPCYGPYDEAGKEGVWQDKMLVWPEKKFAFCWVDKNAGTQFNLLLNHLNNVQGQGNRWGGEWWASSHKRLNVDLEAATKEKGWRFGIFVRDPAERFLSAWASKCQVMEEMGKNCLGPRNASTSLPGAVDVFEQAVSSLPAYMNELQKRGSFNSHYDPQNIFCGARRISEYNFVGHLTGNHENVQSQVRAMFEHVAQVPGSHDTFWSHLENIFPKEHIKGHHTSASKKLQSFYRSPDIYKIVTTAYTDDYDHFKLERGHYDEQEH